MVIDQLPLDSPLWNQLSACFSNENAIARLREVVATRELGDAWDALRDEILHQGSVYGVSSAAIPHLVGVAPHLSAESRRELWIDLGFLVTAGADRFPSPPAPGLQEGLTAALGVAGTLAVRDFLADTRLTPTDSSYYALACVALAGHRVGLAMWEFPSAGSGYVRVVCPGCDAEYEMDGFGDPFAPPCPPPAFPAAAAGTAPEWHEVADAIERSAHDQTLGPGWAGFFETARRVAAAGVPPQASSSAVWCLVAAMVATRSPEAAPWARTLARLAGHVRCPECGLVWAIADVMSDESDAEPVSGDEDPPPATVADGFAGFRPAPGRQPYGAEIEVRTLWRADLGAVDALTLVAGRSTTVAAATGEATTLWDLTSGAPAGSPLTGPAVAVASVALPDGRAVIATAEDTLRWWDAATGEPLGATAGPARVLSLAPVFMPPDPGPMTVDWLARLRDGRTLLAAGDADGVVRLWDPMARTPLTELFQRAGRPVVSLTTTDFADDSPGHGTGFVAVYDDLTVDAWTSNAVHGNRSTMTPDARKLAAAGHERLIGVAVPPKSLGHHKPVLLADRGGTVSLWETFGVRLGDPLPPDSAHREVVGIAVLPGPDGDVTVVTASRAEPGLRLWKPLLGSAALVPLDVRPRCLVAVGDTLLIGHDDGLLAVSLLVDTA